MMRLFLLCLFLIASAAQADSLEKCRQKEKNASDLRLCIEAERNGAANKLRSMNLIAFKAVEKTAKESNDRALLRQFSAQQARHVRNRKGLCGKKSSKNEQVACAADMDYAHIERLARYTRP